MRLLLSNMSVHVVVVRNANHDSCGAEDSSRLSVYSLFAQGLSTVRSTKSGIPSKPKPERSAMGP